MSLRDIGLKTRNRLTLKKTTLISFLLLFSLSKGEKPVKANMDTSTYATPPNPGDATYIVNEFVNAFISDNGGRLFCGDEATFPHFENENVKIQFKWFLELPKFENYPWKAKWEKDSQGTNVQLPRRGSS